MNREQMLARMQALLDTAEAEGRGMTSDEQSEFDNLQARIAGLDATQETRRGLAALRQQSGVPEHIERNRAQTAAHIAVMTRTAEEIAAWIERRQPGTRVN